MNVEEFFISHPRPPAIPQGKRQQTTTTLSHDEMDLITSIAYHPDTRQFFKGRVNEVIRWTIYCVAEELKRCLDDKDIRPDASKLSQALKDMNIEILGQDVDNYFDRLAHRLNTLMDKHLEKEALKSYSDHFKLMHELGPLTTRVALSTSNDHKAFQRFRTRYRDYDEAALRKVDESV